MPDTNESPEVMDTEQSGTKSDRRKRWLRWGLVAFAIFVLVIVPGYIATRPAFLQRFERMNPKYQAWEKSVHAKTTCQQCHVPPRVLPQSAYAVRMLGEFYLSLAMPDWEPEAFPKPTNAACERCHLDLRTVSPKGDLKIPHRAHVSVLKLDCIECHNYLVHDKSPEGKNTPPMTGCLKCHDGKTAKNGCPTCHTNKAAPATHKAADWVIVHADKAKGDDCIKCHKWNDKWCTTCHEMRPRSHTVKWRETHGEQVKKHRSCEACHTGAFCKKCHGEVPKDNLNPALGIVKD